MNDRFADDTIKENRMGDKKIQWHPGFVAALDLKLRQYREYLQFEKEYNLNTKPLAVDRLVIKKNAYAQTSG